MNVITNKINFKMLLLFFVYILIIIRNYVKTKNSDHIYLGTWMSKAFMMVIIGPLVEELVFRKAIKDYMLGFPYINLVNGILFSLYHATNLSVADKNVVIKQMILSLYMGWYFCYLDNVLYSYLLHVLANGITFSAAYINTKKQLNDQSKTNEDNSPRINVSEVIFKQVKEHIEQSGKLNLDISEISKQVEGCIAKINMAQFCRLKLEYSKQKNGQT